MRVSAVEQSIEPLQRYSDRGAAHGRSIARKRKHSGLCASRRRVPQRPSEPHRSDRCRWRAAGRSCDPAYSQAHARIAGVKRALGHGSNHRLADGPVLVEQFLADANHARLGREPVGHECALEPSGAFGHGGQCGGYQAAGAGFGRDQGQIGGQQRGGNAVDQRGQFGRCAADDQPPDGSRSRASAIAAAWNMARALFMLSFHSRRAIESATTPPPA